MNTETPAESGSFAAHCVVWHPPESGVPPELGAALRANGVVAAESVSPFSALAEICVLERAGREASENGAPEGHAVPVVRSRAAVILVLVRPRELEDAAGVVRAVERYAPRTTCWMYDPANDPPLRAVSDDDVHAWERHRESPPEAVGGRSPGVVVSRRAEPPRIGLMAPGPITRAPAAPAPSLRLSGEGRPVQPLPDPVDAMDTGPSEDPGSAGQPEAGAPRERPTRAVLTDEELDMLLGDGGPDQGRGAAGDSR